MGQKNQRETARQNRKGRIRKRIFGTEHRPRLSVFRSAKHIYAQLVVDSTGSTILRPSTLSAEFRPEIAELAMMMANASDLLPGLNITAELYVQHFKRRGLFRRVILFADCCRTLSPQTRGRGPSLSDPGVSADHRLERQHVLSGGDVLMDLVVGEPGETLGVGLQHRRGPLGLGDRERLAQHLARFLAGYRRRAVRRIRQGSPRC